MDSSFVFVPIAALFCYGFLLMAFLAAKKTKVIYSFIWVLISGVLWTGGSFCMRIFMWPSYGLWYHVSILGLLLICYSFWYFLAEFTGSKPGIFRVIWLGLMLVVFAFNTTTGFFLAKPQAIELASGGMKFVYDLTWAVSLLFVACGAIVIHMFILMIRFYREDEVRKRQMRPLMTGVVMIFAGQLLFMLPFFEGIPVDILSAFVMVLCMMYAMHKRRLFKLTLLVSKGSCYVASAILAAVVFSNLINPLEKFLAENFPKLASNDYLVIALIFALFTIALYYVMKIFIDRVFIKDEIIRSDIMKEFSGNVSKSLEINEILDSLVKVIRNALMVRNVYVFIEQSNGKCYRMSKSLSPLDDKSITIMTDNPIIKYMKSSNECLLMDEFRCLAVYKSMWEKEKACFLSLNIECLMPLKDGEHLVGLVAISGKEKDAAFTYDDISFLSSVSSVGSIAVKNSRLYARAYTEARTDELTGLLNRKYFYETLQKEHDRIGNRSLALIIFNIDDFKLYNQLYGFKEGDRALQKIAEIIRASVGDSGHMSRYSGKEFAVILPGYDMLAAKNLAENIRMQILNMNKSDKDYTFKVLTVSGGICAIPYAAGSVKELVDNADMAVYQVKRSGKNGILLSTGGAVERPADESEQTEHKEDIYSEYASTIYALTAAIDTKDHYTFNHSKNVAYYSSELAYACGLNQDSVEIIREAALLHDIGKIGIPEQILNKPEKLTREEYEIVKGHVESSVGIIRHLPSLDYVIPAVIGHHERYDGKGYPRRIAGEDIPLSARILAISDSFDAMISERSYKEPYTVAYALEEIEHQTGKQFDPKLATLFVELVKTGKIKPDNEALPGKEYFGIEEEKAVN